MDKIFQSIDRFLKNHAESLVFCLGVSLCVLCIGPWAKMLSLFIISLLHAYLSIRLTNTIFKGTGKTKTAILGLSWIAIIFTFCAPIYFTALFLDDAFYALQAFLKKIEPVLATHIPSLSQASISGAHIQSILETFDQHFYLVLLIFYITCFFVFSFFFTFYHEDLIEILHRYWPKSFLKSRETAQKSLKVLDDYLYGKIIHFFVLAILSECLFRFFDLPFAEIIALLMGLAVFVPFIGTTLATIPLLVVIYNRWEWQTVGLIALGSHMILHLLNEAMITPMIFSKTNDIHPAIIIASILVFGHIWGTWGVFISIPLTGLFFLWIEEWHKFYKI